MRKDDRKARAKTANAIAREIYVRSMEACKECASVHPGLIQVSSRAHPGLILNSLEKSKQRLDCGRHIFAEESVSVPCFSLNTGLEKLEPMLELLGCTHVQWRRMSFFLRPSWRDDALNASWCLGFCVLLCSANQYSNILELILKLFGCAHMQWRTISFS